MDRWPCQGAKARFVPMTRGNQREQDRLKNLKDQQKQKKKRETSDGTSIQAVKTQ